MVDAAQTLYKLLLICLPLTAILADTKTYKFRDNCAYDNHKLDDEDTYYVTYSGETLQGSTCSIGFYGGGDDVFDEFKVCVTPESFTIRSCNIKVIYSEDVWVDDRTYTCNDYPTEYCVKDGEFLHIDIKNANKHTDANFRLKVYAIKTYDHGKTVGIIVGSIVGGIVFCSVCVVVFIVIMCKRRHQNSAGRVIVQNPTTQPQVQTQTFPAGTYPVQQYMPLQGQQPMAYNTTPQYGVTPAQYGTPVPPVEPVK